MDVIDKGIVIRNVSTEHGRKNKREDIPLLAALIAVNRLVCPRSELGMVRWFPQTALKAAKALAKTGEPAVKE